MGLTLPSIQRILHTNSQNPNNGIPFFSISPAASFADGDGAVPVAAVDHDQDAEAVQEGHGVVEVQRAHRHHKYL